MSVVDTALEIFGLTKSATLREVKRAYAAAVRLFSPEGDAAAFQLVRDAYEIVRLFVETRDRLVAEMCRRPPAVDEEIARLASAAPMINIGGRYAGRPTPFSTPFIVPKVKT
jgi:hypothetical protein